MKNFGAIYRENERVVRRLVQRLGVRAHDADDIVQEIFVTLFRKYANFYDDQQTKKLLYAITVRVCANHRRSFARCRLRGRVDPDIDVTSLAQDSMHVPEAQALANERREAVARAMARLDPRKREVLVLALVECMTAWEIGNVLKVNPGTVASRLRAARRRVSRHLLAREAKAG